MNGLITPGLARRCDMSEYAHERAVGYPTIRQYERALLALYNALDSPEYPEVPQYGGGSRTPTVELLGPLREVGSDGDVIWIERESFDDTIRHEILRFCRETTRTIDSVPTRDVTVYSLDRRLYDRAVITEIIPHVCKYYGVYTIFEDTPTLQESGGLVLPVVVDRSRRIIPRGPLQSIGAEATEQEVRECTELALEAGSMVNALPKKQRQAGKIGRAGLRIVE